ncbi:MAG: HigA family addiction module antidote protein [Gammaproteobacteria bacterium]|nr:HigA family addiction module antidote protein [Gammaproteobacteria bacterium]
MAMKLPPHPGLSIRHDCLEPLGLSVTAAAGLLGLSRQALNNVVNGKAAISADMAIRLDRAFGGGAEAWLRLQMAHDLALARERNRHLAIRRYRPSTRASAAAADKPSAPQARGDATPARAMAVRTRLARLGITEQDVAGAVGWARGREGKPG